MVYACICELSGSLAVERFMHLCLLIYACNEIFTTFSCKKSCKKMCYLKGKAIWRNCTPVPNYWQFLLRIFYTNKTKDFTMLKVPGKFWFRLFLKHIIIIIIIIIMMMMTLFRCHFYLAGQKPTNWGHHFYHVKVDRDLSHDRHTDTNTDNFYVSEGIQFKVLIREDAKV